ncbi:hypothetical protein D1872_150130 [compost metagenome]
MRTRFSAIKGQLHLFQITGDGTLTGSMEDRLVNTQPCPLHHLLSMVSGKRRPTITPRFLFIRGIAHQLTRMDKEKIVYFKLICVLFRSEDAFARFYKVEQIVIIDFRPYGMTGFGLALSCKKHMQRAIFIKHRIRGDSITI